MSYSLWLLTAACLANGGGDGTVTYSSVQMSPVPAGQYTVQEMPASGGNSSSWRGLGLRERIGKLFGSSPRQSQSMPMYQMQQPRPVYQSPEPPRLPNTSTGPMLQQGLVPVSAQSVQPGAPAAAQPANGETIQKVAMADDESWIIGELHYVHTEGGLWEVRYASYDKEDKYGGAVLLAPGNDMSKFHEGDIVFVRGQIVNEGRSSKHVGAPLYKATSVDLNESATELK